MPVTAPLGFVIYPSLESDEFRKAFDEYRKKIADLEDYFVEVVDKTGAATPVQALAPIVGEVVDRMNGIQTLSGTIEPFIYSYVSTSHDKLAMKTLSEFEQAGLPMQKLYVQFKSWMGKLEPVLGEVFQANASASQHAFILQESAEQSKYLMSNAEEGLAAEMSLSGGSAFGKLQGTVTSQMTVDFEMDGKVEKMSMPALINLRSHPDEPTRRSGYEAETKAWEGVKETLAACLNGVKGEAITLNKRRNREDAVHSALEAARIDRKTLEAMLEAMEGSFPMFRRYFKAKAKKLGKEKLAWWDLFAPLGRTDKVYSFEQARGFVLENFGKFSPELAAFAKRAFDNNWIDAEQREGKRGGAFCMDIQGVKESRILSNFDGSLDQVSTLAHELGHGVHNECAFQAGKTVLQQITPMTLAETASTMCETIVMEAVLADRGFPGGPGASVIQAPGRWSILLAIPKSLSRGGGASAVILTLWARRKRLRRWLDEQYLQVHVDLEAALLRAVPFLL
jgi:oligoendopeptidase F